VSAAARAALPAAMPRLTSSKTRPAAAPHDWSAAGGCWRLPRQPAALLLALLRGVWHAHYPPPTPFTGFPRGPRCIFDRCPTPADGGASATKAELRKAILSAVTKVVKRAAFAAGGDGEQKFAERKRFLTRLARHKWMQSRRKVGPLLQHIPIPAPAILSPPTVLVLHRPLHGRRKRRKRKPRRRRLRGTLSRRSLQAYSRRRRRC